VRMGISMVIPMGIWRGMGMGVEIPTAIAALEIGALNQKNDLMHPLSQIPGYATGQNVRISSVFFFIWQTALDCTEPQMCVATVSE